MFTILIYVIAPDGLEMAQDFGCWSVAEEAGFDLWPGHVEFMWKRVAHEQGSLQILRSFLALSYPFTKATSC
jgi:hypothetical protein